MTPHHRIVLVQLAHTTGQASVGYIAKHVGLSPAAVAQAGLELSHKKMVKNSGAQHACECGKEHKIYFFRITGRGREMVKRITEGEET